MAWGPGRYDKQCEELLEQFDDAEGIMLLVARKDAAKSGFSMKGIAHFMAQTPDLLRQTARAIELELAGLEDPRATVAIPVSTADDGPFRGNPAQWQSTLERSLPIRVVHRESRLFLLGTHFEFKLDDHGQLTAYLFVEQPKNEPPVDLQSGVLVLTGTDTNHLQVDFGIVSCLEKQTLFEFIAREDFEQLFEPSPSNSK